MFGSQTWVSLAKLICIECCPECLTSHVWRNILTRSAALSPLLLVPEVCGTAGGLGAVSADHFVLFADLPSPAAMCSVRFAVSCILGYLAGFAGQHKGARPPQHILQSATNATILPALHASSERTLSRQKSRHVDQFAVFNGFNAGGHRAQILKIPRQCCYHSVADTMHARGSCDANVATGVGVTVKGGGRGGDRVGLQNRLGCLCGSCASQLKHF